MPKARKWLPCSKCGRYGSEWVEDDEGSKWTVTAPYGTKVRRGEAWTCTLCLRKDPGEHVATGHRKQHGKQKTEDLFVLGSAEGLL